MPVLCLEPPMIAVAYVDSYTSRDTSRLEGLASPGTTGGTARECWLSPPHPTPRVQLSPLQPTGVVTAYAVTAACAPGVGARESGVRAVGCGPLTMPE